MLLETFPDGSLSRNQVTLGGGENVITHAEAIARHIKLHSSSGSGGVGDGESKAGANCDLTATGGGGGRGREERRAERVFRQFQEGFNASFRHVERIECHDNPFRDLLIAEDTPLEVSLPSSTQGEEAGEYTPGICTIELLNLLCRTHNEILNKFRGGDDDGGGGGGGGGGAGGEADEGGEQGLAAGGGGGGLAAGRGGDGDDGNGDVEAVAAPRVNYLSLTSLVERQLIVYDRQEHLLPLMYVFGEQSLAYGGGSALAFDTDQVRRPRFILVQY